MPGDRPAATAHSMAALLGGLALAFLGACPATEEPNGSPAPVDDGYGYCPQESRLGGFVVEPGPSYTTVSGAVADGVMPSDVLDFLAESGDCQLLHPPSLVCEPACASGLVCDADGDCIPAPGNVSIGPVEVLGLSADVSMEAIPPIQIYNFSGDLPHPAFAPGDRVELYTGEERSGPALVAFGVEDLELAASTVPLVPGAPAVLDWTPGSGAVDTRVRVQVDIANHGGVPARIVCETDDDGELELAAELIDGLLDVGWSGWPTVTLVRQSADEVDTEDGCFDFVLRSVVVLPAEIDGLTSCSGPEDCPPDQTCLPDLTCG